MWYVTMTDKFLSGWGIAENKTNKYVVECENIDQAFTIERNAKKRSEMIYINIRRTKPSYPSRTHLMSLVTYKELGDTWKI